MHFHQAFRDQLNPCIAFAGAGGKTSALFQLARELHPSVIVTVTTHLHINQIHLADSHWVGEKPEDLLELEKSLHGVMLVSGLVQGERTTGLNDSTIGRLRAICLRHNLPMLVEADGSRQRPLKAPAEYEPAIPDFADHVVVVAGLSGIGKALTNEFVHRPEIFAQLCGLASGETITPQAVLKALTNPAGGLKNIPPHARRIALLNQADTPALQAQANSLVADLLKEYQSVIIASLAQSRIHANHEAVAGIILAAGGSRRFGQTKQLLDYHGEPFVRRVAGTALAAGLAPVVVVTGADAQAVEEALKDLPLTIARNPEWQSGQSSSIKTGLQAIGPTAERGTSAGSHNPGGAGGRAGAALFLLADQPQVSPAVIHALVERHAAEPHPIIAPLVAGQRANPVLFDRVTFADLASLTGDTGGRVIFSKYHVSYLPWHDEGLLMDVDKPEDYQNLQP